MTRYAVFLRGVNVGGVNLKMADVATTFRQAGFDDVKTLLASGNVVLSSAARAATVRTKAEAALRESFGYDAWVLVYPMSELKTISADYPFEREVEGHHSYITFVSDPDVLDELAALAGMSRYRLLRAFRAAYGMTPHAWQIDRRIMRARQLLDAGMSLAETALALGFADQSHFQRAFKQRVAATPGEYRKINTKSRIAAPGRAISFKT